MNIYVVKSFSLRILYDEINKIIKDSSNVVRMNMDECSIIDLINECSYYSFIKEHKYVIANKFKINKDNIKLEDYINKPNNDTTLILISDLIDKRSTLYKTLSNNAKIIIIDEIKDLNNKIYNYCKSNNIEIDYSAINKLLENNLNNYDLVLNEIDKISIITNKINTEIVNKYSLKLISEDNFEFCDAVIRKDYKKINIYLNEFITLKQDVSPFIGLLATQYRIIYAVKHLQGSNEEISKLLEIHPYRVKLAKEKGFLYTLDELQKKLLDLTELDYSIKTLNIDKYLLLKIFIINI
ncbi:MAG: DNA polymerase III subunit delta [Bacilli bacterium]|nr:DNA polymerase III subunit delta [Bacilli bacterium]MDD4406754.1 DNA polymerase III subunit delta [Bacilli bacterium]